MLSVLNALNEDIILLSVFEIEIRL